MNYSKITYLGISAGLVLSPHSGKPKQSTCSEKKTTCDPTTLNN